jgi:hypothetical protein
VPFTARLPRLPPELWQRIDRALTDLDACMRAAPRHAGRVEADTAYVQRLAAALKEAGAAIQAAHLKNDVIYARSWPTESQAESWARALLQQGFDPALTSGTLAAWLGRTNGEGERPGGDPVFFGLMRSSLSDFATAFREMTRPQQAPLPDDPLTRTLPAPRTDGEEEHPFLQRLRDQENRKREAADADEERRQELQPLREALQRVDDTLSSVLGAYKPPQQTCEAAAAALFGDLKAFRAALDAAGKGDALEALRRGATLPDERQWLLDALLGETSAEAIAKGLLLGDRSRLYSAWQDLARECWDWHPGQADELDGRLHQQVRISEHRTEPETTESLTTARQRWSAYLAEHRGKGQAAGTIAPSNQGGAGQGEGPAKKPKRSTERGEGRAKIIGALNVHHQYAKGSCLTLEPIGNNELARKAVVSESTVSVFFQKEFKGHAKYRALCNDASRLAAALKLLNGEFSPHLLSGGSLPGEGNPDDE